MTEDPASTEESAKPAARRRAPKKVHSESASADTAPAESTSPETPRAPKRRGRPAKSAGDTPREPELPAFEAAPAPEQAKPQTSPSPAPAVPIRIVGEEAPPVVRAEEPGRRHEAVAFDPSAILARFAPKPEDLPPPAPAVTTPEPAPVTGREIPAPAAPSVTAETGDGPASEAERDDTPSSGESRDNRDPRPGREPRGDERENRHRHDRNPNQQQRQQPQQQGRHPNDRQHNNERRDRSQQQNGRDNPGRPQPQQGGARDNNNRRPDPRPAHPHRPGLSAADTAAERELEIGESFDYNSLNDETVLAEHLALVTGPEVGEPLEFNELYAATMNDIAATAKNLGLRLHRTPPRRELVGLILAEAGKLRHPVALTGTVELLEDGNGLLVYSFDNYKVRELSAFLPALLIRRHGLLRGHEVRALALPARAGETAPMVVKIESVMGLDPEEVMRFTPFTELTPYYPTRRILLETENTVGWDNLSMRCVDLLCPVGLGQRGLIVAPPRTGKTVLMQAMANSMVRNYPEAHLIVLLVDERPEEVTDFKRNTRANEVVASTFDENAESHVHAAEMVIERARRMVEAGRHVIILLDSITRLARAYNTMVPSTGKILSGGVEAGALTRPKRFFGSARNIEGGGSLTILGTALVDTGSKMDEVIFEEFKGTGNMELDLDRDLSNKRIFPAINFEKSGTRKEELLYHADEMAKVYALRRAMKGVPSVEAMEMLIQRIKKTKTNSEFLLTLGR